MNAIHSTARLIGDVQMGKYNMIGNNVVFAGFKEESGPIRIGSSNVIHDNVRILIGEGGLVMGDGCTIHNHVSILGHGPLVIGDECWIGQYAMLDCTGPLTLGNRITIGYGSHIWTHIGRGFDGWRCEVKPVVLADEVWLVGDTVTINPGVTMARGSAALSHSVVTKDTEPYKVYAGIPAIEVDVKLYDATLG
jgi:acetyltransferase-like isoleucine patch superfamily enzyme